MRILQLCHKPPVPAIDGGCIAMNSITKGLLENGQQVKVLAMETFKHRFLPDAIDPTYLKQTAIEVVPVDIRIRLVHAFLNLFSSSSYNINRFYAPLFADKLKRVLSNEPIDLIICESLYTSMYLDTIREHSNAIVVYRAHNVEHKIWELHAENEKNPIKKRYLKMLFRRIKKYEEQTIRRFDSVVAINENEASYFRSLDDTLQIVTVPVGMDLIKEEAPNKLPVTSFFHLGSMDWTPNQNGIKWFIDGAWKRIHNNFPEASLHLAGRKMPEWLANLSQPQVTIHGEVTDATAFIRKQQVMVVPLFSGSGIRVKILEAMALGKTVVCTSTAASGIPFTNGKHLLIADSEDDFVRLLSELLEKKVVINEIGHHAQELIRTTFDHKQLTAQLIEHFESLLHPASSLPDKALNAST
jgi:glycosyltransferase involved in cell wall biosynthesis